MWTASSVNLFISISWRRVACLEEYASLVLWLHLIWPSMLRTRRFHLLEFCQANYLMAGILKSQMCSMFDYELQLDSNSSMILVLAEFLQPVFHRLKIFPWGLSRTIVVEPVLSLWIYIWMLCCRIQSTCFGLNYKRVSSLNLPLIVVGQACSWWCPLYKGTSQPLLPARTFPDLTKPSGDLW